MKILSQFVPFCYTPTQIILWTAEQALASYQYIRIEGFMTQPGSDWLTFARQMQGRPIYRLKYTGNISASAGIIVGFRAINTILTIGIRPVPNGGNLQGYVFQDLLQLRFSSMCVIDRLNPIIAGNNTTIDIYGCMEVDYMV